MESIQEIYVLYRPGFIDIRLYNFRRYDFVFHCTGATQALFHTGWFIESLVTQTMVIYVIRTAKVPISQSSPNKLLIFTSLLI